MNIKYFMPLIWLLIISCSNNTTDSSTLLVYKECKDNLSNYINDLNQRHKADGQKLNLEFKDLDEISKAHPNIVGLAVVSGRNLNLDFDIYMNKFKGICYPSSSYTADNDAYGLRTINDLLYGNKITNQ